VLVIDIEEEDEEEEELEARFSVAFKVPQVTD
jgi:hypothetical protein